MTVVVNNTEYNVYQCKDGRVRCYNKETHKVTSYPRLLMEQKLGYPLAADEDVHHIDGDKTNNNIDNLEVIKHDLHDKKHALENIKSGKWKSPSSFEDKEKICPICGNSFIWTGKQQYEKYKLLKYRKKANNEPMCSRVCVGINNQREQMRQKAQAECQ